MPTITLIGIAILFFMVQLILCLKAKKTILKYIPITLTLCGLLFCLVTYMGIFGTRSSSVIDENQAFAIFLSILLAAGFIGIIFGFLLSKFKENK